MVNNQNQHHGYELSKDAGILLGLGIALIILGTLAIYGVYFATFVTVIFLGFLFLLSGFIHFGYALYARRWKGFLLELLIGALSLLTGILLIANPALGAITLTLFLGALFIVQGIVRIWQSLTRRFEQWKWVLAGGILSLILGILILIQWPYSGLFILGLFVGIDLIFTGWGLIALSMKAKPISKRLER